MQTTPVTVRFKPGFSDYLHASRLYERTTFFWRADRWVAVLLLGYGAWLSYVVGVRWWTVIWLILAPLEWFHLLPLHPLQVAIYFAMNRRLLEKSWDMTVDDKGMRLQTAGIDSRLDWSAFCQVLEGNRVFILVYGGRSYVTIPKRAFASPAELETFRVVIRDKISDARVFGKDK